MLTYETFTIVLLFNGIYLISKRYKIVKVTIDGSFIKLGHLIRVQKRILCPREKRAMGKPLVQTVYTFWTNIELKWCMFWFDKGC